MLLLKHLNVQKHPISWAVLFLKILSATSSLFSERNNYSVPQKMFFLFFFSESWEFVAWFLLLPDEGDFL